MNRISVIILALALAFSGLVGCNQSKVKELEKLNTELKQRNATQDSLLNDFANTFNTFEENLSTIKEKENLIAMNAGDAEMRTQGKEQIIQDITMINDLLDQNRAIIEDLNQKVAAADGKSSEYRRMISRLKSQLEERDQQIATLKDQLSEMDFTIASLSQRVDTLSRTTARLTAQTESQSEVLAAQNEQLTEQTGTIQEQVEALNTAYYVMGSKRELKDQEVLDGRQFNPNAGSKAFTKIDIRQVTSIPMATKKAELATVHPSDSYMFKEENKEIVSLEITNPEKFWRNTKYLVVVSK
jgi:chromosome segregation ATPase